MGLVKQLNAYGALPATQKESEYRRQESEWYQKQNKRK